MITYGKVSLCERCLTVAGHRVRPFSENAHIHCRDYSLPLQRRLVDFAADSSFETASQKMEEHYGVVVSSSSVRAITLSHARCMNEQSTASLQNRQECVGEGRQLIGEMDGSMIPVVLFDEETEGDKRKTRNVDWQEAKLCLVYEQGSRDKRHRVVMGEPDKAGDQWLSCAIEQGLNRQSSIHCVSDGAKWIASQSDRVFASQGHFLMDYYHLCECIAEAARECVGKDEKACKDWIEEQKARMKTDSPGQVLAELEPYRNGKPGKEANKSEECHRYIRNRPGQFGYKEAEAANLPIGSGEIESSNRSVVQTRLKLSGAWWKPEGCGSFATTKPYSPPTHRNFVS
ncbi:hypothetical protein [Endozoicomonas euniceicola]|uniref:ISKra4 family transposase n=1 Tax=Endozoicomonas euniceicola TaxID=1234143 RepID=A0ABY6GUW4_9GAMM|nr:hypothetical protein [Endozoicomonas euniceicola]UYM16566.1 hypothetical protein NX720_01105 [Endozoicomonas euniceicola]